MPLSDGDGNLSYSEFVDALARDTVAPGALGKRGMQAQEAMGVPDLDRAFLGHGAAPKAALTMGGIAKPLTPVAYGAPAAAAPPAAAPAFGSLLAKKKSKMVAAASEARGRSASPRRSFFSFFPFRSFFSFFSRFGLRSFGSSAPSTAP